MAGWLEFALLRRSITARIGRTGIQRTVLLRLWASGLLAGVAGWSVMHFVSSAHQSARGAAAIAAFAVVYGLVTLALGVPEARALVGRVLRR
jgi:hypothetical protein